MNRRYLIALIVLLLIAAALSQAPPRDPFTATFSIVAYDPATGDLGVAVASKFPAVGAMVPFARAGVGAVATQALANLEYGPKGLQMMELGLSAEEAVAKLTENDPQRDDRQLGIVDATGRSAAWTGKYCFSYAGNVTGKNFSAQGNILAGPEVVQAIAKSFEGSSGPLAERLMAALLKSAESKDFVGSNPTLSAKLDRRLDVDGGVAALRSSLTHTQVRSLGSSGRRLALAPQPPVAR